MPTGPKKNTPKGTRSRKPLRKVEGDSNVVKMPRRQPRRVMIATPCYEGKITVWFDQSKDHTIAICGQQNIAVFPVYIAYDAIVQKARNELFTMAYDSKVDDMVFVDADMEWVPEDFLKLLSHPVDFVGGTARKKSDSAEMYVLHVHDGDDALTRNPDHGLIDVKGVGTGFTRLTRKAIKSLWDASELYTAEGKVARNICEVQVVNGELLSEDIVLSQKYRNLGGTVWFDPTITCGHTGVKRYFGNFIEWEKRNLGPPPVPPEK